MKRVLERSQTCVVATSPSLNRLRARCKVAARTISSFSWRSAIFDDLGWEVDDGARVPRARAGVGDDAGEEVWPVGGAADEEVAVVWVCAVPHTLFFNVPRR